MAEDPINADNSLQTASGIRQVESPLQSQQQEGNFRARLTERYNWFLQYGGGMVNGRVVIYEVPNFDGDWRKVAPEDYFAYRFSVKGLKPDQGSEVVTQSQVAAEFDKDRLVGEQRSDALISTLRAYYGNEDDSRLELNNFVLVSHARMRELVRNSEFPAAGTFKYGDHVGVLLNAESIKDSKDFSAEVVHEVGHFERMKSGKDDTEKDVKKVRLEEGIVQANARIVAESGGFAEAKPLEVYEYETSVAERLGEKLGVDLMSRSHKEIEQIMRLSPSFSAISNKPYQYLIDNLDIYVRSVREVDKTGDSIDPQRLNELALEFRQAEQKIGTLLEK